MKAIHVKTDVVEFEGKVSYPWETWADGKSRRFVRGKHFHVTAKHFLIAAHTWAKRHKRSVSGKVLDGDRVVLQFNKR